MPEQDVHTNVIIKGRYELERRLGRGTTGTVYAAWDHELGREVAVKILHQKHLHNGEICARFDMETRVTARLQHPGVVAVFDKAKMPDGTRCYLMSLALGETLGDYIERLRADENHWQSSSLVDRITLFLKILDVIAYAHSLGVVHRDLKPENIVLGRHGEVHILDWGLARSLKDVDQPTDTGDLFDEYFGDRPGWPPLDATVLGDTDTLCTVGSERRSIGSEDNVTKVGSSSVLARDDQTPQPSSRVASGIRRAIQREESLAGGPAGSDATRLYEESARDPTEETAITRNIGRRPSDETSITRRMDRLSAEQATVVGNAPKRTGTDVESTRGMGSTEVAPIADDATKLQRRQEYESDSRRERHAQHDSQNESSTGSHRRSSQVGEDSRTGRRSGRMSTHGSERSTRYGTMLGTPAYMSPEQARGEANRADERADIYGLGVILFEMLTLHTPTERVRGEAIVTYIQRVQEGDRRKLVDLWKEAPQALSAITEWALALDPQDRYPDCETFKEELRTLLVQLSASFAEMERQRLAREREGAWVRLGTWNYQARPELEPFTEPVSAFEGEPIGQVMHPEMGGVLMGGTGLQVYPMAVDVADDIHLRLRCSISRGQEVRFYVRGLPPHPCYCIAVGSYSGRWITISRLQGDLANQRPMLLSMLPLEEPLEDQPDADAREVAMDIQAIGSSIVVLLDGVLRLEVRDPCPLIGPLHRQIGVASLESQLVIHEVAVDQRRSPLMIPSFQVANELLRQKLFPQAIDIYRRFLVEHPEADESSEAHFMLCLAFLQAGHSAQAEAELQQFLSHYIELPLAQDAIFELARIKAEESDSIERAVRVVLSYQEADDHVRSRFCLWMMDHLIHQVGNEGLSHRVEEDLRYLQHLISGFPDSELIMDTVAQGLDGPIADFGHRLIDEGDYDHLERLLDAIQRCRQRGYDLRVAGVRPLHWYAPLAKRMGELPFNHPEYDARLDQMLVDSDGIRDLLHLISSEVAEPVLHWLEMLEEPPPTHRLLRASLLLRSGRKEAADQDLQICFQLMDILEVERTSQEATATARLAFFALDYLPWEVVWEPIARMNKAEDLRALAAWLAECLGRPLEAGQAYSSLMAIGTGFRSFATLGLERLGLDDVSL